MSMRVCYSQSGGFTGALQSCEVNTADLPKPEAEHLKQLVRDSGFKQSTSAVSDQARDLRQFEITIDDDSNAICIIFDDKNVPDQGRQLLEYLRKRAKPGSL
jgi:hypothetical protein